MSVSNQARELAGKILKTTQSNYGIGNVSETEVETAIKEDLEELKFDADEVADILDQRFSDMNAVYKFILYRTMETAGFDADDQYTLSDQLIECWGLSEEELPTTEEVKMIVDKRSDLF